MNTITKPAYVRELVPVIAASRFTIDEATYIYASASEVPEPERHLMVLRDRNEITVVTRVENLPLRGCVQVNKEKWKLLNIRCGNPFYCVGFIASIADALAIAGIDVMVISSFSNDLVLVMQEDLQRATGVLDSIGLRKE